jgi:hypothetical protein
MLSNLLGYKSRGDMLQEGFQAFITKKVDAFPNCHQFKRIRISEYSVPELSDNWASDVITSYKPAEM